MALTKVVYVGNASPQDQTGEIKLADGPNGEPRSLSLGGSETDALVTADELHMLTARFQIEVPEEQPTLTPEEEAAQTPNVAVRGDSEVTLPNPDPNAKMTPEEEEAHKQAEQQQQAQAAAQEPAPESPTPEGQEATAPSPAQPEATPAPASAPEAQPTPSPQPSSEPTAAEGSASAPPAAPAESPTSTPGQ